MKGEDTVKQKWIFYHTLAAMVIPIAFQNLMTALVSASDAVMLGQRCHWRGR